ncbi:hypothetical protein T12_15150 [Trichinella patagoniensis]|uniref:Uncharacterized protein n=1 Tax=Trichinella patagoniensis TaxID=990121 RepID=A0A0V0ZUG2_9BILA|nr:hypothetical protein T12_3452 [Trichinella patagoniensis]KRY09816.1 hypothetical protein T12_15609 [Trichinella patagoniensis]KRY16127.1 hypothetical protein T12_15150 [Trichinella patagoniensis]
MSLSWPINIGDKQALSKPFLENFNEQPASISDVLQLHTEKSIRNVCPILMEEQREHVKTMNVLLTCLQLFHVEIKTICKNFTAANEIDSSVLASKGNLNRLVEHAIVANFPMDQCETIEYSSFDRKLISFDSL